MLKKNYLILSALCAVVFGFVSCSDVNSTNEGTNGLGRYKNYYGTWALMGQNYPMWVGLTEDLFSWAAQGYGTGTTKYDYVRWGKDEDGNDVYFGYPSEERYNAENPAASVTFKGSQVLFDVPSMKNSGHVANYTSASLSAGNAYQNQYEPYAAYWGTYTGTLTVMASNYDITITVANNSFSYSSSMMNGGYTNVAWVPTQSGRNVTKWTLSGYADDDTNKENAKIILEVDLSGTEPAYTFTVNVAAMGKPNTTVTKTN